jgi:serine protease AprX
MAERTITRAVPFGTLPLRLLATALAAALLAALLTPVAAASSARTFLLPAGVDLPAGARVIGSLPVADALVVSAATVPAGAAALDQPVGFQSLLDADADGVVLDSGVASTRAPEVWDQTKGENTVVALIDTGVAPVPALEDAVAGEIDFTGTGGGDGYGHGTFLASLIAARGDVAPGVAPGTGVLSLKVGQADGSSDLGTVMSALQWLYGPGRAVGIRVATLALGVDADSPAGELLDLATARLAADGVLVVTAAGNEGAGNLTSPATSPGTFSVGAVDDNATATREDDVVAEFSGTGKDRVGVDQPDVLASGVRVVGHMSADAEIARKHEEAIVGDGLIRGSGTSMSTALTAGVAALALSARPDLHGGDLAEALRAGGDEVDAPDAVAAALDMPERRQPSPGKQAGAPNGKAKGWENRPIPPLRWLDGLEQPDGQTVRWQTVRWQTVRWQQVPWNHQQWGSERWGTVRWQTVRWQGSHWGDADWDWAVWGTVRWQDDGWQGASWAGEDWQTVRWQTVRWQTVRWQTVRWQTVRWA